MKLSACIIAKNEEKNIEKCIGSISKIVDEIILIDTGSTDNTIKIAQKLGAKIYFYEWIDDFSAARNYALSKAKGDWIIFLDADEYLRKDDDQKLKKILGKISNKGIDAVSSLLINYDTDNKIKQNTLPVIRIFKRTPDIFYVGAIHENLKHKSRKIITFNARNEVAIFHTGYSPSEFERKGKVRRNLNLLYQELKKNPTSSDICFYISETYMAKDNKKAIEYANKVIEYSNSKLDIYEKNYSNLVQCMFSEGYSIGKIEETIKHGISQFPNYPDLYLYLGDIYTYLGRKFEAIEIYNKSLENIKNITLSQSRATLYINDIYYKLGKLYSEIGNYTESTKLLVQLIKIDRLNFNVCTLLLNILSRFDNENSIISFLEKIYNYNDIKDAVFLLKCSLSEKNPRLASFYFSLLPSTIKSDLLKEEALICYYSKDFDKALNNFNELHVNSNNIQVKKIICEFFAKKSISTEKFNNNAFLTNLNITSLQGDYNKEDFILEIINELINLNENELINSLDNIISELGIENRVGKLYQVNHRFNDALLYFDAYLRRDIDFDEKHLGNVLFNMGESLFKQKEYELAENFLKDSLKVYPYDYRVYDLLFGLYKILNEDEKYKQIKNKLASVVSNAKIKVNKKDDKSAFFTLSKMNDRHNNNHVLEDIKRLVIIGVKNISLRVLELFENTKVTVSAFISNDVNLHKKFINGIPVINEDELTTLDYDYLLIMDDSITIETNKPLINISDYFKYNYDFEIHRSFSNFLEDDKDYEGFITGLSYFEVGIETKLLNYKTYNFANSSQDLYYDFEIAKWLVNYDGIKRNIKYAIIGLGYYSFEYDLSLSSLQHRVLMYYPFINKLHNYNGSTELFKKYDEFENKMTPLFNSDFRTNIFNSVKDLSEVNWNKLVNGKLTYEKIEQGRNLVAKDCNKNYPETVIENINIIKEYIEFLLNNDITPILLVCPTSKYYHRNFSVRIKTKFREITGNLIETYNIDMLDYFESESFTAEDFYDISHLNKNGSEKFTKILNEEIERIIRSSKTI